LIVQECTEIWDAMEVTTSGPTNTLLNTVSPPNKLIPTPDKTENAKLKVEPGKFQAKPWLLLESAMLSKPLLPNNPHQSELMLKPGNSILEVSSRTAEPALITMS
jgi:hypothetical protein